MSPTTTRVHITALDGVVNVNSLFTLGVFIGLTWDPKDPANSVVTSPECVAKASVAEDLVAFHVYSFASFLFSSLVALAVKQAIRIAASPSACPPGSSGVFCRVNASALRAAMLVSGAGSVFGCAFLMLALVNVAQIKLGSLGCGGSPLTYAAVVPLVIFVPTALLIYISIVLYAFFTL